MQKLKRIWKPWIGEFLKYLDNILYLKLLLKGITEKLLIRKKLLNY